jgi:hypothetical protein
LSADENATAGNNAAHIVRDASGRVHMVWVDSGRPGGMTGAVYRRAVVGDDGGVRFETGPIELAGPTLGEWNAYPGLAVGGGVIHFVWQAGGTAHYRTTWPAPDGWRWSGVVDTHAPSGGRDVGPAVVADGGLVHVVTPDGFYAVSRDGSWTVERLPVPEGTRVKTASVAVEPGGGVLVAMSLMVRAPESLDGVRGSGGYWGLRVARRAPDGRWSALEDPLAGLAAWAVPETDREDVLVDWTRIAVDGDGGVHLTFHGTGVSRVYANDRSYYLWHPAGGVWGRPISLREPDRAAGFGFSYAPSLALMQDRALPVTFYDVFSGGRDMGFDAVVAPFRLGKRTAESMPVSRFVEDAIGAGEPADALSNRFPAVGPAVYRAADGRMWLDVLETLVPTGVGGVPKLLVYRRMDVSVFGR